MLIWLGLFFYIFNTFLEDRYVSNIVERVFLLLPEIMKLAGIHILWYDRQDVTSIFRLCLHAFMLHLQKYAWLLRVCTLFNFSRKCRLCLCYCWTNVCLCVFETFKVHVDIYYFLFILIRIEYKSFIISLK